MRIIAFIGVLMIMPSLLFSQRVGLVLSGGGSSGLAHIGVIRALEENNIPIHYITGTSMGAFVGAMYAIGMTPDEMEALMKSEAFVLASDGEIPSKYKYKYYMEDESASMIRLKINNRFNIQSALPTNLVKPAMMDVMLLEGFSAPGAAAAYNFDSLMVPFRCVAADIENRQQVIFKNGNLSEAIRASVSYPFYFEVVPINGKILFDGGLYNNFPTDVMYENFLPDIIIGSNVTGNIDPPDENNLLSQVKNMIIDKTNYESVCDHNITISTAIPRNTFDFSNPSEIINIGYYSALEYIDSIGTCISEPISAEQLSAKRANFKSKNIPLNINAINVSGVSSTQARYIKKVAGLYKKEDSVTFEQLKHRFYRLFQDEKIKYVYPSATLGPDGKNYQLNLFVKREKEIFVDFGGHISSKPVNTGFVGVQYNHFARTSASFRANSYFGKYYGSIMTALKFDLPGRLPFSIEPIFTLNRWDYFRSFTSFFEESKPSYIVQNDWYTGVIITFPYRTNGIIQVDAKYAQLLDQYYLNNLFTSVDTVDQTYFRNFTAGIKLEQSTLNRKQFANQGWLFDVKLRYVNGQEETILGSSTFSDQQFNASREWFQAEIESENYFRVGRFFSPGLFFKALYSNRPVFSNYSATIISAPAFQPIPESRTFFQEEFRAHQYLSGGVKAIFNFTKNIHLRLEAYAFLPYQRISRGENNEPVMGQPWEKPYFLGSSSLVFHSPIGPLSFSVNYYDNRPTEPWSVLMGFGYVLFNKRAFD
jgi:NTE family protein